MLSIEKSSPNNVKKALENKKKLKEEIECDMFAGKEITFKSEENLLSELGEKVRSKNECIFANLLYKMKIPYIYEARFRGNIYPDFTIFVNEKRYYIEILGRMDDYEYSKRQEEKVKIYSNGGVKLGGQLVMIDMTKGVNMELLKNCLCAIIAGKPPKKIFLGYNAKCA